MTEGLSDAELKSPPGGRGWDNGGDDKEDGDDDEVADDEEDESDGEKEEVPHNDTEAPSREEVEVPVPRVGSLRGEAAEERVVDHGVGPIRL